MIKYGTPFSYTHLGDSNSQQHRHVLADTTTDNFDGISEESLGLLARGRCQSVLIAPGALQVGPEEPLHTWTMMRVASAMLRRTAISSGLNESATDTTAPPTRTTARYVATASGVMEPMMATLLPGPWPAARRATAISYALCFRTRYVQVCTLHGLQCGRVCVYVCCH